MAPVTGTRQLVPTYLADDGAQAANVLHFLSTGGTFSQANGDTIFGLWAAFWEAIANEGWTIGGTAAWRNLAVDPPDELVAEGTSVNGVGTGDHLPASCAAVISLYGVSGGRRGRGRIYLPGLGEGDVNGSLLGSGLITAIINGFQDFATDIASATGHVPAIYSRLDGASRVVQAISVDGVIDSQRRRAQRLAS